MIAAEPHGLRRGFEPAREGEKLQDVTRGSRRRTRRWRRFLRDRAPQLGFFVVTESRHKSISAQAASLGVRKAACSLEQLPIEWVSLFTGGLEQQSNIIPVARRTLRVVDQRLHLQPDDIFDHKERSHGRKAGRASRALNPQWWSAGPVPMRPPRNPQTGPERLFANLIRWRDESLFGFRNGSCYRMTMRTDAELLRCYAEEKSEDAFAELVRRRVNAVYAVALRQCGGDASLAQDVTQRVFTDLARKARQLSGHAMLGGWLHRSACYAASDVVRAERSRRKREEEAQAMQDISKPGVAETDWQNLAPLLDDAVGELPERDRDAVVARFFEGRSFHEIGAALRLTEDAARMRVERALEKLRLALVRRGIDSTTAALGLALANQLAVAAPTGMAAGVAAIAVAGATNASGLGFAAGFFAMTKLQTGALALIATAGVIAVIIESSTRRALALELTELREQSAALAGVPPLASERMTTEDSSGLRSSDGAPHLIAPQRAALVAEGMKPASEWRNVGRATPAAALETLLWAALTGEVETFAAIFEVSSTGRKTLISWFDALPENVRTKYGTWERLIAPAALEVAPPFERLRLAREFSGKEIGFKIKEEKPLGSGSTVLLHVVFSYSPNTFSPMGFSRTADGWRYGLYNKVEPLIARIDPATGDLLPRKP